MKTYFIGGPWDLSVHVLPPHTGPTVQVPVLPRWTETLDAEYGTKVSAEIFVYYLRKVGRNVWVALPQEDL